MKDCRVCLVEHDPSIHAATVRVRHWLRERLKLATRPVEIGKRTFRPGFGQPRKAEVEG